MITEIAAAKMNTKINCNHLVFALDMKCISLHVSLARVGANRSSRVQLTDLRNVLRHHMHLNQRKSSQRQTRALYHHNRKRRLLSRAVDKHVQGHRGSHIIFKTNSEKNPFARSFERYFAMQFSNFKIVCGALKSASCSSNFHHLHRHGHTKEQPNRQKSIDTASPSSLSVGSLS
jgi:hypothetical protein